MITVKAPGKLYIAGEYAVVEPGCPAILVGLNRYVYATIEDSLGQGTIASKQYNQVLNWMRNGTELSLKQDIKPFEYILSAIRIVEQYAHESGTKLKLYHLSIDSELDSSDGKKYGLGSSAAVTVVTVKALCNYYHLAVTQNDIFKLAALAHFAVQGNGSLGDVAASVFGGWISYYSFDRQWLLEASQHFSLTELLQKDWPGLKITPLPIPNNLKLLIGWTGSPASTSKLIDKVNPSKEERHQKYRAFIHESTQCVEKIIQAFKTKNLAEIQQGLRKNRQLLADLHQITGVEIETSALKYLIESAEKFGGAAKTSGAGGGDCGIVIIDKKKPIATLLELWQNHHILPLDLKVSFDV